MGAISPTLPGGGSTPPAGESAGSTAGPVLRVQHFEEQERVSSIYLRLQFVANDVRHHASSPPLQETSSTPLPLLRRLDLHRWWTRRDHTQPDEPLNPLRPVWLICGVRRGFSARGRHTPRASSRAPLQTFIPTPRTERHTLVPRGGMRDISRSVPIFHRPRSAHAYRRLEREADRKTNFAVDRERRLGSPWRVVGTDV